MELDDSAIDLGCGVTVRVVDDGLEVESLELELAWQPGGGHLPGTAVLWQGEPFEVVARPPASVGRAYRLAPWPEGAAMRTVRRLDADAVAELAASAAGAVASARRRRALTVLAPLAALAPQAVQARWQRVHGYPAVAATYLSAVLEIGIGTLGVLQIFVSVGGGGALLLPPFLHWLGPLGPFILAEGLVRLVLAMSHHQPAGSLLGLPLLLLESPEAPRPAAERPRFVGLDDGALELASPVLRRDWEAEGGILLYRDRSYRLAGASRGPGGWHYRFREVERPGSAVHRLRLEPPDTGPSTPAPAVGGGIRGGLKLVVVATLMSLAPGELQKRWAARHDLPPRLLALVCAGAELLGGVVNLRVDAGGGGAWVLFDALLLAEGGLRLLAMAAGGGPVGSLLGLPLLPLLRRWSEHGD